jgi:hypothetical protein
LNARSRYDDVFQDLQKQKQYLNSPVYIQQAIENRVKASTQKELSLDIPTVGQLPGNNSLASVLQKIPEIGSMNDLKARVEDSIQRRKESARIIEEGKALHLALVNKKDSLEQKVKIYEDSLAALKELFERKRDSVNNEIASIYTSNQLEEYASSKGLKDSLPQGFGTKLLLRTNLRFGKFLLNNSELTVNNIFLTGASLKYGDEKFLMISGGRYDFSFRQMYSFRNDTMHQASPTVFAIKVGKTDGRNLTALSFYVGRKNETAAISGPLRSVAGFSLERKVFFSRNLSMGFEIAKSTTKPHSASPKPETTIKDLFTSLSTRTIAINGTVTARVPQTNTDAEFSYRYWGQQFESFNASQYFNPQNNFSGKISQYLFKRVLHISTGLRYTDFRTVGLASNMKSKTMFASANATLRLKKVPIVSIGYYPGSQLYWLDKERLYEYFYYILNTTVSHYFNIGRTPVQAIFTANRFNNKYSDSLVLPSQSYMNIFVTAWRNNFSYNMSFSKQDLVHGTLNTIETGINYSNNIFRLGGSVKGNYCKDFNALGYSFALGVVVRNVGSISFVYDKSYLPDRFGGFIPTNTGQIQIIKPLKFRL